MRFCLLLIIALAGCDRVFGLRPVPDASIDADVDATPDASPEPCVAPVFDAVVPETFPTVLVDFGGIGNPNFAMVTVSGNVEYWSPIGTGPLMVAIASSTMSHVSLAPGGHKIFISDAFTKIKSASGDTTSWSAPAEESMLLGTAPGRPAVDGTGRLHMVVEGAGGRFAEYHETAPGVWMHDRGYLSGELGEPVSGSITYPSLTLDGRNLVFIVSGSAGTVNDGVWAVNRSSIDVAFPPAAIRILRAVVAASPHLSADCKTLDLVVQHNLFRYVL